MDKLNSTWEKDAQWEGNPSLGLDSYSKFFRNHLKGYKKTRVTVFGKESTWSFCVDDGPNGNFSYGGYCVDCETPQQAMNYVENYPNLFR